MDSKKYELGDAIIKAVEKTLGVKLNTKDVIIKSLVVACNNDGEEPNSISIDYEVY